MPSTPPPFQSTKTFTKLKYAKDKKPLVFTKIHRTITDKAWRLARIEFARAAARFNGRVHYVSQHVMLGAALDCVYKNGYDPSDTDWLSDHWDGICAGLACEWIKWRTRGVDIIPSVVSAAVAFKHGIYDTRFIRQVLPAQENQRASYRHALFRSCGCVHTSKFTSQYPFDDLEIDSLDDGFFNQRLKPLSYYYINGCGHAMAAYVDGKGRLYFYDPDIGVATMLSSVNFLPMYLKNVIDIIANIERFHPEKIMHPKARTLHHKRIFESHDMAYNNAYTFGEYKDRRNHSFQSNYYFQSLIAGFTGRAAVRTAQ